MKRKVLSLFLAFCLMSSLLPMSAAAAGAGGDIAGHWAEDTLREWADDGLFSGDGGGAYRPDASVTRAEFFTLINRWKGYTAESDTVALYTDVPPDAWYYKEVAVALAAGYTSGTGANTISPDSPVTREQAMTIVARLGGIDASGDAAILAKASDGDAVSAWAKGFVAAVLNEGIIAGDNGNINALSDITRAETVVLLDRVRDDARTFAFDGTYGPARGTKSVGSVTVAADGVVLQNMSVKGDVTVAAFVGNGDATLNSLDIKGRLNVLGGGMNSVRLNGCTVNELTVGKNRVRVVLDGDSSVTLVQLDGSNGLLELLGNVTIGTLTVAGDGTAVLMGAHVTVTTLNAEADGTKIETVAGTKIGTANLSGETVVTGAGSITTANISSAGVSIETKPGTTKVASGLTARIGGQNVTGSSSAPSVPSSSGGGGSSGGSSSDSTTPTYSAHNAANKDVPYGTAFGDLGLPAAVTLTANTGAAGTANVTWNADGYDAYKAGAQTITGTLSGATVNWAPATITVTVTVGAALTVKSVPVTEITVRSSETEEDVKANRLPKTLILTLSDDSTVEVSVVWTIDAYNRAPGAVNTFNGTVSGLPAAVSVIPTVTAIVRVAASNTSVASSIELAATPGSVQIPSGDTPAYVTLSAVVFDQFGEDITTLTTSPTFGIVGIAPVGVEFTSTNGLHLVEVSSNATVGSVTAYAEIEGADPQVRDETVIYITDEPVAPKEIVFVRSVSSMLLPVVGNTTKYTFTADVKDQNGALMGNIVTWSLKEPVDGVTISAGGEVTVADTAKANVSFTVVATGGGLTAEKPVTVIKEKSVVASVTISGVEAIDVPVTYPTAAPDVKEIYRAQIKDQYGVNIGGTVTWIVADTAGVSFDKATGTLTVTKTATEAVEISVTAAVNGVAGITDTLVVQFRKVVPQQSFVSVTGPATVDAGGNATYTAAVKSQYGQDMGSGAVVWSIDPAVTGVSVDTSGIVTVAGSVTGGTVFNVKAASGAAGGTLPVTVRGGTPSATDAPNVSLSVENGVLYATIQPSTVYAGLQGALNIGFVVKGTDPTVEGGIESFTMTAFGVPFVQLTNTPYKGAIGAVENLLQVAHYFDQGDILQVAAFANINRGNNVWEEGAVWYSADIAYNEKAALDIAGAAKTADTVTVTMEPGVLTVGTNYAIRTTEEIESWDGTTYRLPAAANASANMLSYAKRGQYDGIDFDRINYVQVGTGSVSDAGGRIAITATALQPKFGFDRVEITNLRWKKNTDGALVLAWDTNVPAAVGLEASIDAHSSSSPKWEEVGSGGLTPGTYESPSLLTTIAARYTTNPPTTVSFRIISGGDPEKEIPPDAISNVVTINVAVSGSAPAFTDATLTDGGLTVNGVFTSGTEYILRTDHPTISPGAPGYYPIMKSAVARNTSSLTMSGESVTVGKSATLRGSDVGIANPTGATVTFTPESGAVTIK